MYCAETPAAHPERVRLPYPLFNTMEGKYIHLWMPHGAGYFTPPDHLICYHMIWRMTTYLLKYSPKVDLHPAFGNILVGLSCSVVANVKRCDFVVQVEHREIA